MTPERTGSERAERWQQSSVATGLIRHKWYELIPLGESKCDFCPRAFTPRHLPRCLTPRPVLASAPGRTQISMSPSLKECQEPCLCCMTGRLVCQTNWCDGQQSRVCARVVRKGHRVPLEARNVAVAISTSRSRRPSSLSRKLATPHLFLRAGAALGAPHSRIFLPTQLSNLLAVPTVSACCESLARRTTPAYVQHASLVRSTPRSLHRDSVRHVCLPSQSWTCHRDSVAHP